MTQAYWRWTATDLAQAIRVKQVSVRDVTQSVLDRIADVNPRINALPMVMADEALAAADGADQAVARGDALGPLHGVPVTIKINVDVANQATTDGAVALKDNIAATDSPLVKSMRDAGAILVGRSNAPAFSLRWFADNELHGRTLNPFDAGVTPGGSSGGAAAAVAMGMGPIAHGNDYGGSVRYPAWACGVVGLRTTVGRVPSYKASAPNRIISNQHMSVQGPLTRTVADARLALQVMSQGTPLDPQWVPAPIDYPGNDRPVKVALFKHWGGTRVDPTVVAALEQAAQWLADAGYEVDEVAPPHFDEMGDLYRHLVLDDLRRAGIPAMMKMGDAALRQSLTHFMGSMTPWDRDQYLDGLVLRFNIARDWAVFSEQYPVLLMPNSWERQFPIDDDLHSQSRFEDILLAQTPLLSTALLGLPGLSVPTGVVQGLPVGVQIVTGRFREDLALHAGAVIERAAQFSALDLLAPR
ncbi:MAG: amidase family protein [Burkholderiaceae bacterium]|nr:amidase family protein [Burkholderiaceae bacterium]